MGSNSVVMRNRAAQDAELADPALFKLRDLVYRISGIFHAENKFYLLALRSRRRMKEIGSDSFGDYLDQLTTRANRDVEMRSLLNEITIGETYFFRSQSDDGRSEQNHFPQDRGAAGQASSEKS